MSDEVQNDSPEPDPEADARRRSVMTGYIREVAILWVGVFIGFVWRLYFEQVSQEAHIIVILLIIILCMARYIHVVTRK